MSFSYYVVFTLHDSSVSNDMIRINHHDHDDRSIIINFD